LLAIVGVVQNLFYRIYFLCFSFSQVDTSI